MNTATTTTPIPVHRSVIVIGEADARRLSLLLEDGAPQRDAPHLLELREELERAVIVQSDELPHDVITMQARASVLDLASGARQHLQLVYPHEADPSRGLISVLAPLGTALLGYRAGDEVSWSSPGGPRRLRIENVRSRHEPAVRH
jgi:regulator of nucleoside diphosphate kinase